MTTTAHERALNSAEKAYYTIRTSTGTDADQIEKACQAYLQALLDDAETVEGIALAVHKAQFHPDDSEHTRVYELWEIEKERNFIKSHAVIATLKRMGGA